VNRLLRVANDEELPGDVGGEREEDVRLDRIGVLKLVDQNVRELALQVRAHVAIHLDERARLCEQVGEVERAGRLLQRLIPGRRTGQLLLQARGEIGVRLASELQEIRIQGVAGGDDRRARDVLAELVAAALARARESPVAREIHQTRLPAVQI